MVPCDIILLKSLGDNIGQSFRKGEGTPIGIKQPCELPFAAPILLFMELQKVWCPIKLSEKVIEHLDFVASNLHFWLMLKWIRMESWLSDCSSISAVYWKPIIVECTGLQRKWLGSELIWFVFGLHLALVFVVVIFCSCCDFTFFSLIFKANHCGMQRRAGKVRFALSNLCGQFLHFDIFLVVYDLHLLCRDCEVLHQLPITFLCLYLVYFLLLQLTFFAAVSITFILECRDSEVCNGIRFLCFCCCCNW